MTVNLTRIYTRLGDGGETHLGDRSRVSKADPRIEAYGTVDELGANLGVALTLPDLPPRTADWLRRIQNDLFDVGADLAVPPADARERLRVEPEQVAWLEQRCDEVNAELEPLRSFVLSGGTPSAAWLHVCRTVCRRAERRVVALGDEREPGDAALPQPAQRPAVHPRARRQQRRRAALGAGPLPLSCRPAAVASRRSTPAAPTRPRSGAAAAPTSSASARVSASSTNATVNGACGAGMAGQGAAERAADP